MSLDFLLTEPLNFLLLSLTLAVIPLTLWLLIFWRKHPVDRSLAILTTLGGMMSVLPIWAYQWLFDRYEHLDVFGAIYSLDLDRKLVYLLTFIAVGVIEEQFKHWVVTLVDYKKKEWRGIADGIEFAILAALGFAFIENIVYFVGIMKMEGYAALIVPFVFRSAFSTFAHVFFSGVYGYHFGISKFAKEWMIEKAGPKGHHQFLITKGLYRLFRIRFFNILARLLAISAFGFLTYLLIRNVHLPIWQNAEETMFFKIGAAAAILLLIWWLGRLTWKFWEQMQRVSVDQVLAGGEIYEGLFLAMLLHAIFNFVLWLEMTWLIPIYLFAGYWYLSHELRKRRNLLDMAWVEENLEKAKRAEKDKKYMNKNLEKAQKAAQERKWMQEQLAEARAAKKRSQN